ncbi:hypothetical protein CCACVL1_20835 [Corchorus capsularis]|uniref:Uncharacterized protein n=1 Tax=Corchorus capsularis TaxID=210143 RepID=A0A1R3H9J1_COCAP|nr:hypothetical protein CCACVL1_20835 [Corchorus capsularis]
MEEESKWERERSVVDKVYDTHLYVSSSDTFIHTFVHVAPLITNNHPPTWDPALPSSIILNHKSKSINLRINYRATLI